MKIEDFLSRLEKVERSASGWIACCPAHGDSNPSLSVSESGGKILVHCHAGCSASAIVEAMGLKMRDLFTDDAGHNSPSPQDQGRDDGGEAERAALGISDDKKDAVERIKAEFSPDVPCVCADADGYCTGPCEGSICCKCASYRPKVSKKKSGGHGKWVCDYDYTDESGNVIYKACRYVHPDGRKDFKIKRPDPESKFGWSFGLKAAGIKRVPYRLKNVVTASEKHRQIIVVEGEKDVESVEKALGMVATCNVGGALKWGYDWPEDWIKWFQGSSGILIIADNDPKEKTDAKGKVHSHWRGQKHAWDVRRQLLAAGFKGPIKLMVMPQVDGQANVKDFTDWVEARKAAGLAADRDAFAEALKGSGEWPEEWEFDDATLAAAAKDGARAEKSARAAISNEPKDGDWKMAGRFGRLSPRSPSQKERWFEIDFQIRSGMVARFEIGVDRFKFEGWQKDSGGTFVKVQDWKPLKGSLPQFVGMAVGCMVSWDAHFKLDGAGRLQLVPAIVVAWLRARGKFFADKSNLSHGTSLFFDGAEGVLYRVHSDEFLSFVATSANLNREDKAFRFVMSLIDDLAMDLEISPRIVPAKQWARPLENGPIYISCGDSLMCRVSANGVEFVQNGTDDVVFERGSTIEPWTLEDGNGMDPFAESLLCRNAAFESENDRMNCRLWFLNLFACHKNKPILLLIGPARSGKTRLLQGMKQFLWLRECGDMDDTVVDVDPSDKGLDSFWILVDRGRFVILDNCDTKVKWGENAFQTASTGGSSQRRMLYASDRLITLRPNASIGITSNNPIFTTAGGGLPDRIVTARVAAGRKVALGKELLDDIQAHHSSYMTWIARILSRVLADKLSVDETINERHPDYGKFSVRCGRAMGDEVGAIKAMNAAEHEKAILPLTQDSVARQIVLVLLDQDPVASLRFTSTEMSEMILKRLGEDNTDSGSKDVYGPKRVGNTLNKRMKREFSSIFRWSIGKFEGRSRYEFSGLTENGSAALDALRSALDGGLEGFRGFNGKTSIEVAGAGGSSESNPSNPSNPPYARAQAHGDLFDHKREDEGDEIGEYDDLTF